MRISNFRLNQMQHRVFLARLSLHKFQRSLDICLPRFLLIVWLKSINSTSTQLLNAKCFSKFRNRDSKLKIRPLSRHCVYQQSSAVCLHFAISVRFLRGSVLFLVWIHRSHRGDLAPLLRLEKTIRSAARATDKARTAVYLIEQCRTR